MNGHIKASLVSVRRALLVVVGGSIVAWSAAGAQQATASASWQAWIGCWSTADAVASAEPAPALVCVTPTSDPDAVQFATVGDGKTLSAQLVNASGRESAVDAKGCTGVQRARWSADGRRLFLDATADCAGVVRKTSGILAMSGSGAWLDVQGISAGGAERVRTARYAPMAVTSAVPADIADALRGTAMASSGARVAAGGDIGVAAVIEASKLATTAVVEAFLLEREQPFPINAATLVQLADAGISTRITDALVAVSNPRAFAISRPARVARVDDDDSVRGGNRVFVNMDPYYSPYGWGYGYSRFGFDRFGYDRLGFGYGGGFYGGGYSFGGPVVIVRGSESAPRGRLVKGRGYERGTGGRSNENAAEERTARSNSPSERTGTQGPPASERPSSSGSSGSSGSSERTAKPRP